MRVQDRLSAVVAAHADRRVVISAVAVPVEVDRISLEDGFVTGIHESPVLLEVRDLLHYVDPRDAVLVPHGVLLETAVIETLGDKVRAVPAFSLVAVVGRIVIDAVFISVSDRLGYVVGIGRCGDRCHHLLLAVFREDSERIGVLALCLQRVSNFFLHPVKVAVRIFYGRDLPLALSVAVEFKGESIAVSSRIDGRDLIGCVSDRHPLVNVEHGSLSLYGAAVDFDPRNQRADLVIGGNDIRSIFSLSVPLRDHTAGKLLPAVPGADHITALGGLVIFEIIDESLGFVTQFGFYRCKIGRHHLRGCENFLVRRGHGIVVKASERFIEAPRSFRRAFRSALGRSEIAESRLRVSPDFRHQSASGRRRETGDHAGCE